MTRLPGKTPMDEVTEYEAFLIALGIALLVIFLLLPYIAMLL
jgi:hypothetical protein